MISLTLSVYFLIYSHAAVTDMALTLFITLSLFSFYLSVEDRESPAEREKRYIYGFYLFSAFAFLTKGLIGIVFPFGIALLYLSLTEGIGGIRKAFDLKGVILFLLVSAPWYGAQLATNGQEFIRQFFIKHHLTRYTGVISGHRGPFYYYLPALLIGMFPWIAFLPAGIKKAFKEKDSLGLFASVWFLFITVFFSFSTTKLPNYVLPAIPAASLLIGMGFAAQHDRQRHYPHVFAAVLAALAGIGLAIAKDHTLKFGVVDNGWVAIAALVLLALGALNIYALFVKKTLYEYMSPLMIVFLLLLSFKAFPVANHQSQEALYRFSLYAKERLRNDERIIVYGLNNPSIVFYSGHKVITVNSEKDLNPLFKRSRAEIAIAKAKDIDTLRKYGFALLEKEERYAILERK